MFITRIKSSLHEFLSDWSYVWAFAILCFAMSTTFGWKAIVALRHNLQLNDVVVWYGRGNGNIQQYYLSTLIVYSLLWLSGGLILLLSARIYSRTLRKNKQ